jgi:hypothetical protein
MALWLLSSIGHSAQQERPGHFGMMDIFSRRVVDGDCKQSACSSFAFLGNVGCTEIAATDWRVGKRKTTHIVLNLVPYTTCLAHP